MLMSLHWKESMVKARPPAYWQVCSVRAGIAAVHDWQMPERMHHCRGLQLSTMLTFSQEASISQLTHKLRSHFGATHPAEEHGSHIRL